MLRFIVLLVVAYLLARAIQKMFAPTPAPSPRVPPRREAPASERSPDDVLGVSPGATSEQIRAAYQRLVRENHPDRVADMSREIRDLAERRTKEINRAYEQLKRS